MPNQAVAVYLKMSTQRLRNKVIGYSNLLIITHTQNGC